MNTIQIQARGPGKAEILIFDTIGETIFGDGLTAKSFDEKLKNFDVSEILVRINSPGGNVWDGLAIYNTLKNHPARISVQVDGIAASIASVIAMAGDTIEMGTGSAMMVHSPHAFFSGTAEEMRDMAEVLDKVESGMLDAYTARTGLARGRILSLMAKETWFTAQEAIDAGFADGLVETKSTHTAAASWQTVMACFKHTPESLKRNLEMTTKTPKAAELAAAADNARAEERQRVSEITEMCGKFKMPADFTAKAIADGTSKVDINAAINEKLYQDTKGGAIGHAEIIEVDAHYHSAGFQAAAADGLLLRAGIPLTDGHPAARDIQSLSLHDLARTCLAQSGRREGYLSGHRLIKAAMTTSDFPSILENSLNKAIRRGYETEPASHRAWVRVQPVSDFRDQARPILGSAPELETVLEMGEYKHGSMEDDKATYKVTKFGRIVSLSWEALVNDDLGAFLRVQPALGQAARRKEADVVYALFTDNSGAGQTMQDSDTLFHANHNNIATAGVLNFSTLGAARTLLRKQTALGGGLLSLVPRFLIVAAEEETNAEILLASATRHIATGTEAVQPEWISKLELVVEPRLDNTAYYLAANSEQIDTCELGILDADGLGPMVEDEIEFEVDAKRWKVRHVFAARFLDWRGIVQVPAS